MSTSTSETSRRSSRSSRRFSAGRSSQSCRHLAVGLEHDRELAVAARDLQQALGLQPLLPQRRAAVRAAPRDQQRARGRLAEARAEQRRAAELGGDQLLDLVRARAARRRRAAARRRRAGAGSRRRPTRSRPGRGRARRAAAPRSPSPRRRARARRTASARTGASRRSRRGSARPRPCGRTAPTRVASRCSSR